MDRLHRIQVPGPQWRRELDPQVEEANHYSALHNYDERRLYELENPADPAFGGGGLRAHLRDDDTYIRAMAALGEEAVIEVGEV